MDFFHRQALARRQTRSLLFLFISVFAFVVLALDAVFLSLTALYDERHSHFVSPLTVAAENPGTAIFVTVLIVAVLGVSSLFKSIQLRAGGGGVAARSLGGVRVVHESTDLKRKRLLNIIEEMSIAAGVPVPEVYVLEGEGGINAFAAGHTPANAAVAVTQGALDQLNREELQGVIAHEFSHVLNGDMRLNVQLVGWLFGMFVFGTIGREILRSVPRARRGGAPLMLAAGALVVLGFIGTLGGRILQAAVARQRERLADASAVQFTRNPQGLRGALLKIAGLSSGSTLSSANVDQVAHMLFAPGASRLFATHPPLLERLQALDSSVTSSNLRKLADAAVARSAEDSAAPRADASASPANIAAAPSIQERRDMVAAAELAPFASSPELARALVFALLLSTDARVQTAQLKMLSSALTAADVNAVSEAAKLATVLAPEQRLPALLRTFPALRRLDEVRRREMVRVTDDLIKADARMDVFEFCLAKLLETLLEDQLESLPLNGSLTLQAASAELGLLFAALSHVGTQDVKSARMAYEAGLQPLLPMDRPGYSESHSWPDLSAALTRLDELHPLAKQPLVDGLLRTVLKDGKLNTSESELLRVVCATLHCPAPSLLSG